MTNSTRRLPPTGGPVTIGSRVIFQLLAAGRELRAVLETRDVQATAPVLFIAADRDHDEGRLDSAAGCEFVDDRIRLRE
jgi:hypothetical protein